MSNTSKFWPVDLDSEAPIYENVAWDLPGFRARGSSRKSSSRRAAAQLSVLDV